MEKLAIKLLIGGSPCTFWSIAQTKEKREVEAEGLGWELFKNYLIAKDKFKPDLFLYENNVSATKPIKEMVAKSLGVDEKENVRYTEIDSQLVSAQKRKRFYVTNFGDIKQPEDREIFIKDILENINVSTENEENLLNNPVCVNGKWGRGKMKGVQPSLSQRIYSIKGKATALTVGFHPKIAIPISREEIDSEKAAIQEVRKGKTVIEGEEKEIKLPDGYYLIRRFSEVERERLQTLPDNYCKAVSKSQTEKALGNGWTAEVIIHLLDHALKDVPRDEKIIVLSLYDGIATGRYCLDKMGFTNVEYHAYEIDRHSINVALDNYPDIIQHGDAFAIREKGWGIYKEEKEEKENKATKEREKNKEVEINVLSLFDGISCGMVALERAGLEVKSYYAYEIERNAIKISEKNYPNIQHKGDVTAEDFTKYKGKIDVLIGGSPCQNLCSCGDGTGLEGVESRLFFDYVRALYEAEPKWFLLENNATMTKANQDKISEIMGIDPVFINSNLVSAQDRKRLYWTNIPGIVQPEDKGLLLRDIVQPAEEKREFECYKRMKAKVDGTLAYKKAWGQVRTLDQKARALTTSQAISNSGATNVKYADDEYYILTPIECERLQTLPDNYTEGVSNTQRYKAIGNGWTVDVIAHILRFLKRAIAEGIAPVELKERERPVQSFRRIGESEEEEVIRCMLEASEELEEETKEEGKAKETKEKKGEEASTVDIVERIEAAEEQKGETLEEAKVKEFLEEKDNKIAELEEKLARSEEVAKQIEELKEQVFNGFIKILFTGQQVKK